jgi:hypothetical protein
MHTAHAVGVAPVPLMAEAGTPAYMAPEQWRGEDVDAATDLWAMGVILYRLLAGRLPFLADTPAALAARVLSGEPPLPLERLRPDVPTELCQLVEHLLRFDRKERPRDAVAVTAILEDLLGAEPSQSRPLALPGPLGAWSTADFWVDPDASGWLVHQSSSGTALRYWQKMLLVFVPDSTEAVWQEFPAWLLEEAGVDVDVLLYRGVRPGAVDDCAGELRALLDEQFRRQRHIIFVTHGAGTQVVLRLLADDATALWRREGGRGRLDTRSPFYRVRCVAAIVPGKGVSTVERRAQRPAAPDAEGAAVEAEFVHETQRFGAAKLLTPALYYFGLGGDGRSSSNRDRSSAAALATAIRPDAPLIKSLAQFLTQPEMMLAWEIVAQGFELDSAARIAALVGSGNDDTNLDPTVRSACGGTQAQIYDQLLALCRSHHRRAVRAVVTGDAGVGKSTVLRMLGRTLSGAFLSSLDTDAVFPIFVPLYFVKLQAERLSSLQPMERAAILHELIIDWWCEWVGAITYAGSIDNEWVTAHLRGEPVVLILDGVDEFLTNHPSLGIADMRNMLGFLSAECGQNGRLTILLGVRSTQPGLVSFASDSNQVYEVLRLTTDQAIRQFPTASNWLDLKTAQVEKMLLTPLILAQLDVRGPVGGPRPTTRTEIIQLALSTIVEQSELHRQLDSGHELIEASRWIDALMIVASCLFRRLRGEIAISALKADAAAALRDWEQHLDGIGQREAAQGVLAGIRLLCDDWACDALVRRTILYPTGPGEIRFLHREWQDYLTARYLATCIRWGYLKELGHFAFTLPMFLAAGEMLRDMRIEAELVRDVEECTRATGEQLIHANFSAVLGNSRAPMSGPAMSMLLGDLKRAPLLSRLVILASFGNRGMMSDPSDASVGEVRRQLLHGLMALVEDERVDRLSRSLAWCNIKAFHQQFGTEPPPGPWPGLGEHEEDERPVLELICDIKKNPPQVTPRHRSLQIAWVQIQTMVPVVTHRPLSAVHYLYTVVVAKRHHAHIPEVSQELPAVFQEGSPVWQGYKSYTHVPEVWTLFCRCRDLFYSP